MDVNGVMLSAANTYTAETASPSANAGTVVSQPPPSKQTAQTAQPVAASDEEPSSSLKAIQDTATNKGDKESESIQKEELDRALEQINKSLSSFHREMKISVHEKLNRIMVKVMDTEENKVIREIPPEKLLDAFAKALEMAGVLLDVKQ